jgi:hypothetical protein
MIPDHRLMIVGCNSQEEAYYLMSMLNSSVSRLIVQMYVVGTQISTHVVQHVAVPKYSGESTLHSKLATLGRAAANAVEKNIGTIEADIDKAAAEIWGISPKELGEIQSNLAELQGVTEQTQETENA